MFALVRGIGDPELRCRCLSRYFYVTVAQADSTLSQSLLKPIIDLLTVSLEEIDIGWEKVRAGFEAATSLATHSPEDARRLLSLAETAKQNIMLQTASSARAYIGTILLSLSAYAGLLPRRLADVNDLRRLGDLVDRIPSDGQRARVWAELALRAQSLKNSNLCQQLVAEHVRPLIQQLQGRSPAYAHGIIASVAPALYVAFPVSAREELSALTPHAHDLAYHLICQYVLAKHTSYQPFELLPNPCYDIDYDRALEICELAQFIDRDDIIYIIIMDLINSLYYMKNKLTRDQSEVLAAKLTALVPNKFPNAKYITHNGYAICIYSLIEKFKRSHGADWSGLESQAMALPNLSDRVFVLCSIASACQPRDRARCKRLLEQAYQITQSLPCVYDRVARIEMIATQAWEVDPAFARRLLESGMKTAIDADVADTNDLWPLQRDMLDFAHRVDPQLAVSLASMADTDLARQHTRLSLHHRLEILNMTKSLADGPSSQRAEN
jgi:hypothetical protein